MKRVYKYATGQAIPDNAVYLCTKTETLTIDNATPSSNLAPSDLGDSELNQLKGVSGKLQRNILVWHYFLV